MSRVVIASLVLAAYACSGSAELQLTRIYEAGRVALLRGELPEARVLSDQGLTLLTSQPESEWAWKFRLLRGEILVVQGEFTSARPLLTSPMPLDPQSAPLRSRQKFLEARMQQRLGEFTNSLDTLEQARRLAPDSRDEHLAVDWFEGQTRLRLGQWAEGEAKLNSVIARSVQQKDRHQLALALGDMGMGLLVRGRYDEALSWFERVLALTELKEYTVYGLGLYNAGICYARLGNFERAAEVQQRAVTIQEQRGPSARLQEALGSLGTTYGLKGEPSKAVPFFARALTVALDRKLDDAAALWAGNLATAHAQLGNWDDADRYNKDARRFGSNSRSLKPVYFTLNDAQIAAGRGDFDAASTLFDEALTNSGESASVRWTAHAGIARAAIAAKQQVRASRHFEAALDIIEKTRSNLLRTEFKLSFLTQLIEFYQAYVDSLIDQGRVEKALEVAESSRGRVLAERHGVQAAGKSNAAAFRAVARQSGAVLLSYWLTPTRSHVWVVGADGIRGVALPPARDIETLVREHQVMIDNTLADPLALSESPGGRLYDLLVAPVSKWIPHNARVVVVPDGALHRLNFETLPVSGARRHYWIEDVEIQVAPTLAMLSMSAASTGSDRPLLLIGDPAPHEPQFPALRYASAEMSGIAKHFGSGTVTTYQRDKAVPAAFRDAKPDQFGMIHFTAHASANSESPLDSAVILSGPDHAFKLYARDVAEQPLRADLVTVSACRSAGERTYSGEGLIGFAWAFLRAGSRRVVAGLWDVNDRSTAELMEGMYQQIAAGGAPPRALREAKLSFLRKGGNLAKPYYWGPFQVFTLVLEPR
jgi:CHAT domain-containing protein/tetratricopeptide (TPR) repeat protein